MKKILFVIYSMKFGGAERSLVNLLQELPENKYEIDLLLFQKTGDFLPQIPAWINVLDTPEDMENLYAPLRKTKLRGFYKIAGTGLSRFARKSKKAQAAWRWRNVYSKRIKNLSKPYDVAIAYAGSENLYFIRDKIKAPRKLVWIHNDYRTAGYSKQDDLPYFSDMDGIVSVSRECVEVLKQEFPQYAERIQHIDNITSSAVIKKQADSASCKELEEQQLNILSIGRLHPQKGFDTAIDAAAILKRRGYAFRWYVIGDGPLREKLEARIQEKKVEDCFILLGTRKNPYPYIKESYVIVQSSLYEGKSVVLDEAKILCKPIVATAYPTVHDQIVDGEEGLITGMTAESVAEGIIRLVEDRKLYSHIKEYLEAHEYGNESEVEKYMALIDKG